MGTGEFDRLTAVLAGEEPLPWQTPRLRALAEALPAAAERHLGMPENRPWARLRALWSEILDHAVDGEPGWDVLAGACVAAVDILAGRSELGSADWPLARAEPRHGEESAHALGLGSDWKRVLDRVAPSLPGVEDLAPLAGAEASFQRLRRPQIHALLRGAPPARVHLARGSLGTAGIEPEGADVTRALLRSIDPSGGEVCWSVAIASEGRSAMAAMALRWVAERAGRVLAELGDVGITGELDVEGRLLPVAALPEKVRRFFVAYPGGTCFVPQSQVPELDGLRPEPWSYRDILGQRRRDPTRLDPQQWARLVPVSSLRHLLVILGEYRLGGHPSLRLFEAVVARGSTAPDWRGRSRAVTDLATLPMKRAHDLRDEERRFHTVSIRELSRAPWGEDRSLPSRRRLVITGRPGSGKSMVLRQLHQALGTGEERLRGPSILLPARRLLQGRSLAAALTEVLDVSHDAARATLEDAHLTSATWLLLDGLDELPLADRRRAVELIDAWPGPTVIATRGLPEQLPSGDVVVVQDLDSRQAAGVLEAEGRKDLAEALRGHGAHQREPQSDPLELLRGELARTPLGVSLLAMVWNGEPTSRQDLLRDAVIHLVRRAEAEGHLSPAARRRFERQGLRVLGAAAWRMLSGGRAILTVEDLEAAERDEGLRAGEGDLVHEAVENGGFVQPVGPGAWEFSHKSFAELAAARYLAAAGGERPWAGPAARLGDPSADEVLLHLSTIVSESEPLLVDLLSRGDRWLSALRLSTRVLLEARPGSVRREVILLIARDRLRLWCALPDQELPGGLRGIEDLQRAVERHRGVLTDPLEDLLGACPEVVQRWARDPDGEGRRLEALRKQRRAAGDYSELPEDRSTEFLKLTSWLHRCFVPPDRSLRAMLATTSGRAELRQGRPRDLINQLPPLFDDRDVGGVARDLWWELAPDESVLARIGELHPHHPDLDRVLRAVARRGTPGQRREALLRATLAAGEANGDATSIVTGLSELDADEVAGLWEPAWRWGVLAEVPYGRAAPTGRDQLLASFVDDELPEARWRALVALRGVIDAEGEPAKPSYSREREKKPIAPMLTIRLKRWLEDPDPFVRAEALAWLADGGVRLGWAELLPSLLGGPPSLRLVALRAALVGRPFRATTLVHMLTAAGAAGAGDSLRFDRSSPLPWAAAMQRHASEGRAAVIEHLREVGRSWPGLVELADAAEDVGIAGTSTEALGLDRYSGHRDAAGTLVRRALRSERAILRRWGVCRLGWQSEKAVDDALIEELCGDADAFVAEQAREERERRGPRAAAHLRGRDASAQERDERGGEDTSATSPAELDETALHYPVGFHGKGGRTVAIEALLAARTFEEAWKLLGRGALKTQVHSDMEGSWLPGNEDRIMEYAAQAADENRQVVRQALAHLRTFYTSDLRPQLIQDLGHPSRGLFAKFLLALEPSGRELLPAIRQNPKAAHRVAELARSTPLALAVVDELVAGIAKGALPLVAKKERWGRTEPELLGTVRQFGGREALFRLVVECDDVNTREVVIAALLDEHQPPEGDVAEGTAAALRAWVRLEIERSDDRSRLLHLLAMCGDSSDVRRWKRRVESRELSVGETAAVARLVGERGTLAESGWLRQLAMSTASPNVVYEVVRALGRLGGTENAAWLMERLHDPPPCIVRAREDRRVWDEERERLRSAARDAGTRDYWHIEPALPEPQRERGHWEGDAHKAIVRHGDDELGMRLAWHLAGHSNAIGLCEEYGHLPSHALLVLGAIEHDPGEHAVGGEGEMTEVVGSGVPERVREAVDRIVKRCGGEPVRAALLVAMLRGYGGYWGSGESYGLLENIFFGLGGPRPSDLQQLLDRLDCDPDDPTALRYLALMGIGEAELLDLWRKHAVPWLDPT